MAMSTPIDTISAACAVIVDPLAKEGFRHLATAWQVAPGEWLSAWTGEEPPPPSCQVIATHSGEVASIESWEQDRGIAGFRAAVSAETLSVASESVILGKRQALTCVGYPSVIAHPSFAIHRGSLSAERYHPYLCPWQVQGHLALFTQDHGWLAGLTYHGMLGSPVVTAEGLVVGLLSELPDASPSIPPLSTFRRISS